MEPYLPPAKRRKYRVIEEDDEEEAIGGNRTYAASSSSSQQQQGQYTVNMALTRPSDRYDIFDFVRFCSGNDTIIVAGGNNRTIMNGPSPSVQSADTTLLPEMRDFARRLGIIGWASMPQQALCASIKAQLTLLSLPPDVLYTIAEQLSPTSYTTLAQTAKQTRQLLEPATRAQRFVSQYGLRAYEILFGRNVKDITPEQYAAAKEMYLTNTSFFTSHDISTAANTLRDQPSATANVEIFPGIVQIIKPATRENIRNELLRQRAVETTTVPVPPEIWFVQFGLRGDIGLDVIRSAQLTRRTPKGQAVYIEYNMEVSVTTTQSQFKSYENFGAPEGPGWYMLIRNYGVEKMGIIHNYFQLTIRPRYELARAYYRAIIWSTEFERDHPELHPILELVPNVVVGPDFVDVKARMERAISQLMGYEVVTATGRRMILPLQAWLTAILKNATYVAISNAIAPDQSTMSNEYDPLVPRYMDANVLKNKIYNPLQRRVQSWWANNVYPDVPVKQTLPGMFNM